MLKIRAPIRGKSTDNSANEDAVGELATPMKEVDAPEATDYQIPGVRVDESSRKKRKLGDGSSVPGTPSSLRMATSQIASPIPVPIDPRLLLDSNSNGTSAKTDAASEMLVLHIVPQPPQLDDVNNLYSQRQYLQWMQWQHAYQI
jgi:hypothetical protein